MHGAKCTVRLDITWSIALFDFYGFRSMHGAKCTVRLDITWSELHCSTSHVSKQTKEFSRCYSLPLVLR
ncbi:hypothetical protein Tco_1023253, partial [Tanacetum coccineum]